MNRSILFFTVIFSVLSASLYAQDTTCENALNKQIQMMTHLKIDTAPPGRSQVFSPFYEGWSIKFGCGLTNYKSGFTESNYGGSFEIAAIKKINSYITISSHLNIMNLKGERNLQSVIDLDNQYYYFYEGNGDYFKARMTEVSLVFSGDFPERLLSVIMLAINDNFVFPKRLNIYYNIGIGACNFHSIRYNSISNSYVYAYGYNDLQGDFETRKPFWDLPKSTTLIYGASIDYELTKASKIYLSSFMRYAYTPYVDSDKGSGEGDRFRNISLGYIYSFNFPQKKFLDYGY
jgi:hypothetical protein